MINVYAISYKLNYLSKHGLSP